MYFKEANWDHILDSLFLTGETEGRLVGDVKVDGHFLKNTGIRYKGFSSANVSYKKNPFNIELDYTIPNQNHLGFTKIKLSNVIHDPSFIREVLSYEIARKYMPAARANFANVYVNDTLIGLYTNVESVDKEFISKHFTSQNNSFFKGSPEQLQYPFGQNANLAYTHGTDSSGYIPYYKIESDYGWKDLFQFIYNLNNDSGNLSSFLNIDRALWMHAFNYCLLNLDSYIGYSQNYYLYRDDNGQFNTIPWDLNMSFGSFRNSDGSDHFLGLTIAETKVLDPLQHLAFSITPRPLMTVLFNNTTYRRQYIAHLRTILHENFSNGWYFQRAQELQAKIDTDVQKDTNKFETYANFIGNLTNTTATGTSEECPGIKDLMEARMTYLESYPGFTGAPQISDVKNEPEHPARGSETWVTARISATNSATLSYRNKSTGIFTKTTLFDDGNHHDGLAGDSVFGSNIQVTGQIIQYFIYAENDGSGMYSPERAEYEFYTIQPQIKPGDLVINEFMTNNVNTAKNPQGDYADWVELFNPTKEDIHLKGIYFSDNIQDLNQWAFPDTVIASKSYMILWADKSELSGVHLNFTLAESGGQLLLSDSDGRLIDSVYFDKLPAGKTMGRSPNGNGHFTFMMPSYSRYNEFIPVNETTFAVFPNPARNMIYCEMKNSPSTYLLEIFNSITQRIYDEEFVGGQNYSPFILKEINLEDFHKGVYIIRITTVERVMSSKFVVY